MKQYGDFLWVEGIISEEAINEAKKIARAQAEEMLERLGASEYIDSIVVGVLNDPYDPLGETRVFWKVSLPDGIVKEGDTEVQNHGV